MLEHRFGETTFVNNTSVFQRIALSKKFIPSIYQRKCEIEHLKRFWTGPKNNDRSKKINRAPGRVGPKSTSLALAAASDLVFVGAKMIPLLSPKCLFSQRFLHILVIFGAPSGRPRRARPRPPT